jgi:hypothetical protein
VLERPFCRLFKNKVQKYAFSSKIGLTAEIYKNTPLAKGNFRTPFATFEAE